MYNAAFDLSGAFLVTASDDKTATVWDVASGAQMVTAKHDHAVYNASFNMSSTRFVTASRDSSCSVWDVSTGARLFTMKHRDRCMSAVFDPSGSKIVTASFDKTSTVWDIASGTKIFTAKHKNLVFRQPPQTIPLLRNSRRENSRIEEFWCFRKAVFHQLHGAQV